MKPDVLQKQEKLTILIYINCSHSHSSGTVYVNACMHLDASLTEATYYELIFVIQKVGMLS